MLQGRAPPHLNLTVARFLGLRNLQGRIERPAEPYRNVQMKKLFLVRTPE